MPQTNKPRPLKLKPIDLSPAAVERRRALLLDAEYHDREEEKRRETRQAVLEFLNGTTLARVLGDGDITFQIRDGTWLIVDGRKRDQLAQA